MRLEVVPPKVSDTIGLASAYQVTNVTGGAALAVLETGGHLLVGVTTLPYSEPLPSTPVPPEPSLSQVEESERPQSLLDVQMMENPLFRQLVKRGVADLEQGHYKDLREVKRKLGDL